MGEKKLNCAILSPLSGGEAARRNTLTCQSKKQLSEQHLKPTHYSLQSGYGYPPQKITYPDWIVIYSMDSFIHISNNPR